MNPGTASLAPSPARRGGRDIGLDLLKVGMAFLVVAIHTGMLTDLEDRLGMWPQYVLLQGIARVAVPTFLVISGFYFAPGTRDGPRRWLMRAGMLYLIWMALYLPQWWPAQEGWRDIASTLWFGWFHLWYLVAMVKAGAILWLMRDAPTRLLISVALALIGAGWILQERMMTGAIAQNPDLTRNALFVALPFMILGHCLGRLRDRLAGLGRLIRPALAVALALMAAEIVWNGTRFGTDVGLDTLLTLALVSPLLVGTVIGAAIGAGIGGRARRLSDFATALYLLHPAMIALVGFFGAPGATAQTLVVALLASAAALALLRLDRRRHLL